jgi:hypothetical protein
VTAPRRARPGRRALFSEETLAEPGRKGPVVECRTCLETTQLGPAALAARLVPSLWLPGRPWPRLMRCPACKRVSWCRIRWGRFTL